MTHREYTLIREKPFHRQGATPKESGVLRTGGRQDSQTLSSWQNPQAPPGTVAFMRLVALGAVNILASMRLRISDGGPSVAS